METKATTDAEKRAAANARQRRRHAEKQSKKDRDMDRRVALWNEAERIRKYLPTLHRQREEALRRLADLDRLISDEEAAVAQIEKQVA